MALVLVDTNVIIEAVRTHCWNAITGHHQIETVSACCDEAAAGDTLADGYISVGRELLDERVRAIHTVTDTQRAALALIGAGAGLDAGERDLFAHELPRASDWLLGCADRAAVLAACSLGWPDRIVSLESLANQAGARPKLRRHFTESWLSEVRTRFRLDEL